jgi:predicted O-methyltransferase YrrM
MSNLSLLINIFLLVVIIGLLIALTFKQRRWIWDIHQDYINLRNEIRRCHQETNSKLSTTIDEAKMENINATCLAALHLKFPIFLGDWSIDSFLGRYLIQHILENHPKCIVELGSGSSTILIARTLTLIGEGNTIHIAIDHDEKFIELTRNIAKLNGVINRIEFILCPLIRYEALDKLWYEAVTDKLGEKKIDLLLIDGPPGSIQKHSRYPALPILKQTLAEHCTVILDDAIREEEQEIAKRWKCENPEFKLDFIFKGHGLAILTR